MNFRVLVSSVLIVSAALLLSCQSASKGGSAASAGSGESADLTWTEAQARKARVSDVKYTLSVQLNETDPTFKGVNKINFNLKDNTKPLRVDFFEGQVTALKINGKDAPLTAKRKYWIDLPAEFLVNGANVAEITYVADYSKEGVGLHRFQDPETKQVFLYTDFEPYDANRFLPCFDQPDLRASLELTVEAPADWQIIANTMESKVTNTGAKLKQWTFPATPPIATYIFALHAGPYKVWKDEVQGIPLRIYARPSMAKYVRVSEFMNVTKQGFRFFNDFFAMKYPFKKYDQIFVPEFNSGAMENVAAVTFSENFLVRSKPTREQQRGVAGTILHEMAHMWFGDIVTMAWWNDLWLNESFASFMATLAMDEATGFKEAWQDFFVDMKDWAYWEDSLVTTHPIEATIPNVKDAFATFDGITYGKGASVLKQLRYYIGAENFKKGIRHYMKIHAYKNTTLADFMSALQSQTDKDLKAWAEVWLRQSGTDTLTAKWACTGNKLDKIELVTTPSANARFRPQTVEVGLFKNQGGKITRVASTRVDLNAPKVEVKGSWACPDAVYPNDKDYGYASVILDPVTLKTVRENLAGVSDIHLRNMIWNDLWEMVRNGEMPLKDYIQVVNVQFPKEKDILIQSMVVETISGRGREQSSVVQYWPDMNFIQKTEQEYFRRFKAAKNGSDEQKFWFDSYVVLARSESGRKQLKDWMGKKDIAPGFPLDLDRHWSIVRQLARFEGDAHKAQIEGLKQKDTSDRGVRQALAAEAIQPVESTKQKWVETLTQPKPSLSLAQARVVMSSVFPLEQSELAKPFDGRFYDFVKANAKTENEMYLRNFAQRMVPLSCEPARASSLRSFIQKQTLSPAVSKALKVSLQEDERCQMIRQKSGL